MTIEELENAKEYLRNIFDVQKNILKDMFSVSKDDLEEYIQRMYCSKEGLTNSELKELVAYMESYLFVKHDHEGYVIVGNEPFDRTWYTKNKPKDEYFWNLFSKYHAGKGDLDRASLDKLGNKTLPNLMNCLGNPLEELNEPRKRYGLVLGDVQSGKTSTYAGLICKAADAGMKVVILLSGVTETLRQQTQERMEEDVVGLTIRTDYFHNTKSQNVGVGTIKGWENRVSPYTLYEEDFNKRIAKNMTSIGTQKSLVLFVVKKNVPVLTHLLEWLTGSNQQLNEMGKLPYSLLLIDDEADNASINTKDSTIDPTATNKKIREICEVFMNSNYVGFTATPYANIFINPETDESMVTSDLFPKDFIYVLPTPESYIGALRIFGEPSIEHPSYGDCSYMLEYIADIHEPNAAEIRSMTDEEQINGPLYFKHKKYWKGQIPESLKEAVRCFYLANAIRDLDAAQISSPRTMLINVSRYVDIQSYLKKQISQIVSDDYKEIRINFSTNQTLNNNNELYKELYRLFNIHYSDCGYTWEQVLDKNILLKSEPSRVIVVNGSKEAQEDTPNYKKDPSLRIIAVGGLALSRGLTLKGLMTSYFYRNTCTYDVLMQMGRWFGYRPHYEKICRIWITNTSANWYREIAESTDELKSELAHMNTLELTPKEFGLRIRHDDAALEITARNKMRTAGRCEIRTSFWGDVFETPYFSLNPEDNIINVTQTKNWINSIVDKGLSIIKDSTHASYLIRNVCFEDIVYLLRKIITSDKNLRFNVHNIVDFILNNKKELVNWDVVLVGGRGDEIKDFLPNPSMVIKANVRQLSIRGDEEAFSFTNSGVVSGNNDGRIGLENPDKIKEEYLTRESSTSPRINRCTWFKYAKRNPVLFIYPVKPSSDYVKNVEPKLHDYLTEIGDAPIMGYAIGVPGFGHDNDNRFYYTNTIYQNNDGVLESEEDQ